MVFDVSVFLLKLHVYVFIILCTYLCFFVRAHGRLVILLNVVTLDK